MSSLHQQFRPANVLIDFIALQHNAEVVRQYAPEAKIMAAIKADGYGHGIKPVAQALNNIVDEFGVASTDDALRVKEQALDTPVTVFSGFHRSEELIAAFNRSISFFVYDESQLDIIEEFSQQQRTGSIKIWLKVDTGMSRLGFSIDQLANIINRMEAIPIVFIRGIVSHLANSDCPTHPQNKAQYQSFQQLKEQYKHKDWQWSLANSGALIAMSDSQYDWVRPGIMLYGSSPLQDKTAEELGLKPVMTLKSQLISIRHVPRGQSVGYGSTWTARESTRVGVVACGYGDGYPRHIDANTPVLVNQQRTVILGRVSMDLIVVDLTKVSAKVGDEVILWGDGLPVDEIAISAETIAYELMCGIKSRVQRLYVGIQEDG